MPTHACARVPACHTLKHTDAAFKSMRLDDGWSSSITDWGGGVPYDGASIQNQLWCVCMFVLCCVCVVCVVCVAFVCLFVCAFCVFCVFLPHTQHTHNTHTTQHTHTHTHTHTTHTLTKYGPLACFGPTTTTTTTRGLRPASPPARPPARPYSIVPHAELRNFVVGVWFFAISNALSLEYGPLAWWDLLIIQNSAAK
jgi:hypothetical protein